MCNKSKTLYKLQIFKTAVERELQLEAHSFHFDRGDENLSTVFHAFLHGACIKRELTQAYTRHQNGVSERKNRTILEKARAMFLEAQTPCFLWVEAIHTAYYLANHSSTRANL